MGVSRVRFWRCLVGRRGIRACSRKGTIRPRHRNDCICSIPVTYNVRSSRAPSCEDFCSDFMTGKEVWKARGKGSLTYADGMFYFFEEKGTMKPVRATPEKYDEVSSFEVPEGGEGLHWAHPVVYNGRLYVRHADTLFVYDIKEK